MHRWGWMLLLAACTGSSKSDDTGTDAAADTDTDADTDADADTDTDTDVDTDTNPYTDHSSDLGPPTLLLVLDSSDSMRDAASSLALGAADLFAAWPPDTMVALTTMDVEGDGGTLLATQTDDPETLAALVLCEATCFPSGLVLPSDPGHTCGDPLGDEVTSEWLDCACGAGAWQDQCASAQEEGLEALARLICRADAGAPSSCFDGDLDPSEAGTVNLGGAVHAVLVSDEGDASRRLAAGDLDTVYGELLGDSTLDLTVSAVVPGLDVDGLVSCPGVATAWGVQRYVDVVASRGGSTVDIYDGACEVVDVGAALADLAP